MWKAEDSDSWIQKNKKIEMLMYVAEKQIQALQSRPLVRSAFCPKKLDHTSKLTLHPGYNLL